MEFMKILFNSKVVTLPKTSTIPVHEVADLFNVERSGIHLKVKLNAEFQNIYPIDDEFQIPVGCNQAFLIAIDRNMSNLQSTAVTPVPAITNVSSQSRSFDFFSPFTKRRGNSASGSRAVPSHKRSDSYSSSTPLPLKKKKTQDNIFKTITISDVAVSDNIPMTIYEVPVDLTKLQGIYGEVNIRNIQEEIQNQIGGEHYILTNKKGNPIRDMPNTRGMIFVLNSINFKFFK